MTTTATDIDGRIAKLVSHLDQTVAEYFRLKFSGLTPPTHAAQRLSDKWTRINRIEDGKVRSVYCFVCTQDGYTKALGTTTAGDIHKAATFKAPAKHARGSVFLDDFGDCLQPFGIKYLR